MPLFRSDIKILIFFLPYLTKSFKTDTAQPIYKLRRNNDRETLYRPDLQDTDDRTPAGNI